MPIRVTCNCGYSTTVPDEMAGKSGKCPKCKSILKIPGGKAGASGAPKPSSPKPAAQPATTAAGELDFGVPSMPVSPAIGALDGLFEEAGLVAKKGATCPSCGAAVAPGSVLCVKCGFHLVEGRKLEEHRAESKKGFGNVHLNEAAVMMEREKQTEKQLNTAGAPWWMMFSILVGISVMITGLVIKQQAATTEKLSSIPILRRIQEAGYLPVLSASFGLAMMLTANFANIAILVVAFKESTKHGFMYLFVPFYSLYYMFSRIKQKRLVATVIILLVTGTLGAIGLGFGLPRI